MKKLLAIMIAFFIAITLSACEQPDVIIVGEGNWDSNAFHDQVVKIIIEEGYGIDVDVVPADTSIMVSGLKSLDVNLTMELWSENVTTYAEDIANGEYIEVSTNFDDNAQGLYIPRYLQEEYPGLVSVADLLDYPELFPNPEGGDLGIIYGGPEGWGATIHLHAKMIEYGLDEFFTFKTIDSSATLNATLASAYAQQEPWVGYNWEPTWALGVYDMVLLEDSPYNSDDFDNGIGSFSSVHVNIAVDSEFESNYPEVFAFLTEYTTSSAITASALAYMQENEVEADEAAIWFLLENTDLWESWVTEEAYQNVLDAIQ